MKDRDTGKKTDRQPAVAGSFYPADPDALRAALKDAFSQAEPKKVNSPVIAIVSPHAGYVYSAKVAASAFNQIDPSKRYDHIFVIGSSHRTYFEGASVYTGDYITPLGKIKTDPLAREIAAKKSFSDDPNPHLKEHSLEVEMPFLQYVLKNDFSIIPIILGTQSPTICKEIAEGLKPYFNDRNLFVISTDFSHYPDYRTAKQVDTYMADAIVSNSPEKLIEAVRDIESRDTPDLFTGMCGWPSVLTLLDMSSGVQGISIKKVDQQNSGDVKFGDRSRVVGYVALAFEMQPSDPGEISFSLSSEEKRSLIKLARNSIKDYLNHRRIRPAEEQITITPALKMPCGAFVSLHSCNDLRGCVGTFRNDRPLYENVQEMAIASANHDNRFDPVKPEEAETLSVEISVLTPMRRIASIEEIVLGKHGIFIRKDGRTGTFLPQVATDRGWTREKFLGYCSRDKAGIGWNGWKNAEIYVYEALVFSNQKP